MKFRIIAVVARATLIVATLVGGFITFQHVSSPRTALIRDLYALKTPGIVGVYALGVSGDGFGTIRARWMAQGPSDPSSTGPMAIRDLLIPNHLSDAARTALLRGVLERASGSQWRCSPGEAGCHMTVGRYDEHVVERAMDSSMVGIGQLASVVSLVALLGALLVAIFRPVPTNIKGAREEVIAALVVLAVTAGPVWALAQVAQ